MLPPHRWPFAAAAHCSYSSLNTLFALYTQRRAVLRPAIFLPVLRQQIWRTKLSPKSRKTYPSSHHLVQVKFDYYGHVYCESNITSLLLFNRHYTQVGKLSPQLNPELAMTSVEDYTTSTLNYLYIDYIFTCQQFLSKEVGGVTGDQSLINPIYVAVDSDMKLTSEKQIILHSNYFDSSLEPYGLEVKLEIINIRSCIVNFVEYIF
ncbi:Uncharacterized protein FWK35_00010670 [Aphis craccivora]|uniref:Uncharacterized protein n=1 Tax=Aphis craccivora TaxID=307492 RepID=A0A6G0ZG15_APHCR|nr:Uncharacterized protein FWK35_00010670 [Aphis craccivora]